MESQKSLENKKDRFSQQIKICNNFELIFSIKLSFQ